MANRIKGITVEINGDTTKLTDALKNVNRTLNNTQSQLKDLEKLLKLDPTNTELLAQKQSLLTNAVSATSEKLDALPQCRTAGIYTATGQQNHARLYRVPLHMIGDLEHATFSNIEQQSLEFVKYSLDPWLVRWEQSLQKALLSDSEKVQYFIKFNVEGLLRGDYASRMQGYATARQNGWMSANDIRELEDMNMIHEEGASQRFRVRPALVYCT